jgi:hypothetical protein
MNFTMCQWVGTDAWRHLDVLNIHQGKECRSYRGAASNR